MFPAIIEFLDESGKRQLDYIPSAELIPIGMAFRVLAVKTDNLCINEMINLVYERGYQNGYEARDTL